MKRSMIILLLMGVAWPHQPVMDMAPRWAGGWGFQFRYETLGSNSNAGLSHYRKTTWFEGVYTWKRSIRATFKLPYHQIESKYQLIDWGNPIEKGSGLGDLILALPLKKYFNLKRSTGNFGLTPQIRLKTGDESNVIKSKSGYGLSLSYSAESFSFYQLYDIFGWIYSEKDPLLGLDINLGIHPYHDNVTNTGLFAIWDVTARWQDSSTTIQTGPVFMPYRQNIMARAEVKFPVIENGKRPQLSKGLFMNVGIGFVF